MFEPLYDVSELTHVHFIGYATEHARYDFSIVYTDHFFGKTLVICMQTGRSALLDANDLTNTDYLQLKFSIANPESAAELALCLAARIPSLQITDQYE